MWGMDMSRTVTLEEGRPYVFVAVERANSEIVSTRAAQSWLQLQCGDFQTSANVWASKFRRPPTRLSSALDPRGDHFHWDSRASPPPPSSLARRKSGTEDVNRISSPF